MKNPEAFDGKSSTAFNQWWEAVTMFLGFYPATGDQQKIAWIGTILSDTALVWHLQCFRELKGKDTWANYAAAIQTEYRNEREAADAQLKLLRATKIPGVDPLLPHGVPSPKQLRKGNRGRSTGKNRSCDAGQHPRHAIQPEPRRAHR